MLPSETFGGPLIYSYDDAAVVTVVYRARVAGRAAAAGRGIAGGARVRPAEIPWEQLAFRSTFHALRIGPLKTSE